MKSPLFSEHFEKDNWTLAYFNALREAYTKTKAKTDLESLLGKKKHVISHYRKGESSSQTLFELPEDKTESPALVMSDDRAD
jgi:hypothetical protein